MEERFTGPWPDIRPLLRGELAAYLADLPRYDQDLPTRCRPWTVRDVTRHLAATFERFAAMLAQARRGDLTPPFGVADLDAENLRAVRELSGDPAARLRAAATEFLDNATDPDERMAHQRGPIPVGVQLVYGLRELALHHDDVAAAAGEAYQPPEPVVTALAESYRRLGHWRDDRPAGWAQFVEGRES